MVQFEFRIVRSKSIHNGQGKKGKKQGKYALRAHAVKLSSVNTVSQYICMAKLSFFKFATIRQPDRHLCPNANQIGCPYANLTSWGCSLSVYLLLSLYTISPPLLCLYSLSLFKYGTIFILSLSFTTPLFQTPI